MRSKPPGAALPPVRSEAPGDAPAFPVWKAFAVQFSRETRPRAEIFSGRVEHLSSGRRARFGSVQELVTALEKLLDELGEQPT